MMEENGASVHEKCPLGVTILGSGSKGNCTVVHYGRQAIMIDAGFSCRETQRRIKECHCLDDVEFQGILVTHEHVDHMSGLRLCSQKLEAPIYATLPCTRGIRDKDPKNHSGGELCGGWQVHHWPLHHHALQHPP